MAKIVNICLYGPVTDGWTYQDNLLPKYQLRNGNDVSVITSKWVWDTSGKMIKISQTDYYNEYNIHTIRIDIRGDKPLRTKFKRFINLYETIKQEKPDILFVHNFQFLDIDQIIRYKKENPSVLIYVDNHCDYSNSATNWLSKNILHGVVWKIEAQRLAPFVKKFYGVIPARVDFLVDLYGLPKGKCELLVMGADDDKVQDAAEPQIRKNIRGKYGVRDNDFLIMTGGKIDPWKKQTLLLMEAVAKIKNPKVKLLVFGSVASELKEEFEKRCMKDKVIFAGWIKSDASYSYVAASDLMVFPGRHSVFWEQVCGQGKPMIVKYWKGTTHVDLGGNVEFLYEDSVEEIYKKIMEIVDNPEKYKKMKEVAESKGMDAFSYKKIAERSITC